MNNVDTEAIGMGRQTELWIECNCYRLLQHEYYEPVRGHISAGGKRDARLMLSTWGLRLVFFGDPGDTETLVWSDRLKTFIPNEEVLFEDELWKARFGRGKMRDEAHVKEPTFYIAHAQTAPVLRVFLTTAREAPSEPFGFKRIPSVLATLPIALFLRLETPQATAVAESFGLRTVENKFSDHYEDDFGEGHLTYPAGGPGEVYENDLVRFRIRRFGAEVELGLRP